jgi:hypothetical protein
VDQDNTKAQLTEAQCEFQLRAAFVGSVTIGTRRAACTTLPTLRWLDGGVDVELSQNQIHTVATISEVLARYTNCDNRMDWYSNGRLQAKGK